MKYKVKFNIDEYITYYTKNNKNCDIDLNLWIEKDGNSVHNFIISDNKPVIFELCFILICTISDKDDNYVSGQGELDTTEFCLTIQNGKLDLSVKPMLNIYSGMQWDIFEEDGDFTDGEQLLNNEIEQLFDSSDLYDTLNSSQLKQCLLKHITIEQIED